MRNQQQFHLLTALASVIFLTSFTAVVDSAERVKVQLQDGRVLDGEVDPRTDADSLWLRFQYSSLSLSSPYAWSRIVTVQVGQKRLSSEEFRELSGTLINNDVPIESRAANRAQNWIILPRSNRRANGAARVASLWATARLANWDRDAEMDGLEVCIVPRNLRNELIRVPGNWRVTLVARNHQPPRNSSDFPELGKWSVRVDAGDFHDGCAVYRFPFRRSADPQTDLSIRSIGLVQLQFQAFGHGLFKAETPVQIRSQDPVRRDLQRRRSGERRSGERACVPSNSFRPSKT